MHFFKKFNWEIIINNGNTNHQFTTVSNEIDTSYLKVKIQCSYHRIVT